MSTLIRFRFRQDTAANWTSVNPVLRLGEAGIESDTILANPRMKIGDGVTAWNSLTFSGGGGGASNLSDLGDVNTAGAVSGNVLEFNGTTWVPGTASGGASALGDLTDVTLGTLTPNEVLKWTGTTWADSILTPTDISGLDSQLALKADVSSVPTDISDLSDVNTTGAVNGQFLKLVSGVWQDASIVEADITDLDKYTQAQVNALLATKADTASVPVNLGDLANVIATAPSTGQVLKWNGSAWAPDTDNTGGGGVASLNDIPDVSVPSPATNNVLSWNGAAWVDVPQSGGASALNDLSDVSITAAVAGEVLRYNGSAWVDASLVKADISDFNEADYATGAEGDLATTATQPGDNVSTLTNDAGYLTGITAQSIGSLSDVTITAAVAGEVLRYNGSAWVDAALVKADISDFSDGDYATAAQGTLADTALQTVALNDNTDVTITAATAGEVLRYNGSAWVNAALVKADISNFSDGDYATAAQGATADAALPAAGGTVTGNLTVQGVTDLEGKLRGTSGVNYGPTLPTTGQVTGDIFFQT